MIHFIFVTLTWKGIQLPGLVWSRLFGVRDFVYRAVRRRSSVPPKDQAVSIGVSQLTLHWGV